MDDEIVFSAQRRKGTNFVCDACFNIGSVTVITYPETLYFNRRSLSTKYHKWWLCDDCIEKLKEVLK